MAPAPPPHLVRVYVLPDQLPGPDGKHHDAFVPSSFVVQAGRPVVLVVNYDPMMHSFTVPSLWLNAMVRAARSTRHGLVPTTSRTTFEVRRPGVYRWNCLIPCDDQANYWAMRSGFDGEGQVGFMVGWIVALK